MFRTICVSIILAVISCSPVHAGKRVVFIGDSITDGNWGCIYNFKPTSAQRSHTDLNHIYGHSYMMLVASDIQSRRPKAGNEFFNRGFSGHKLSDLAARWQEDVLDLNPDILSVLVGINDAKNFEPQAWKELYRSLLTRTREQNPDVVLALGTPFTTKEELKPAAGQMATIVRDLCKEFDAVCIPYDELFEGLVRRQPRTGYWIWDGIHPTPAGHRRMADLWEKKVRIR